jgi:hypothetical protein
MIRGLDDEVRTFAAEACQRFLSDLSASGTAAREALFNNAVRPFLAEVWPQERSLSTPGVSKAFADIPAAAGERFAEAVEAVAAYHLWERIVRSWTKAPAKADHEMLVKLVEAKGITVHFRMAAIRDLNNALKHNSEKYGPALLVSWPELFSARFREGIRHRLAKISGDPTASKVNWHEAITINSDQMDELMDAVRASGPIGAVVRRPGAMLSAPE